MPKIVYDLRRQFGTNAAGSPADELEDHDDDTVDITDKVDVAQGDEEREGEADDGSRRRLNREAAKHRRQAKAERERAEQAEADARDLRLQLAFMRLNAEREEPFKDADHAYESCDLGVVKVAEDETVTGLREAMDHLAERYPYLVQPSADEDETEIPDRPSGRSVNRKRQTTDLLTPALLAKKYPALRRR